MVEQHVRMGTQFEAPDGIGTIPKGVTVHFLINAPSEGIARLVQFEEVEARLMGREHPKKQKPPPVVVLHTMPSAKFEHAIEHGLLIASKDPLKLPLWRAALGDRDVVACGKAQKEAEHEKVVTHETRLAAKLKHMAPILEAMRDFLVSRDPIAEANEVARLAKPPQNQARFRADLFLYLAFNLNPNAIAYRIEALGRWNRRDHAGAKCGVEPKGMGRGFGTSANDDDSWDSVERGWEMFSKPGRPIKNVYRLTQIYIRKCKVIRDAKGRKRFILPSGEPSYTYNQFYYRLSVTIGMEAVRRKIYGRARYRESFAPSQGKFSEQVNSIAEIVQEDGYYVPELAMGPDGKTPLPALLVVRIVCVATAMCLGIGFALGGETGAAYRMARFCMEVDKVFFCWLLGIDIDKECWPSEGGNDDCVRDRGPGQALTAEPNDAAAGPTMREMPPTGFGQGKPNVEATNPRDIHVGDRPTYITTAIPLIHLIRKAVQREIARMDSASVEDRLGPARIAAADRLTPLDLYEKLAARGRTFEISRSREEAIRRWTTKIKLTAKHDGVYIGFQRYSSSALEESGTLDHVPTGGEQECSGYALDMARRYVWVEVQGRLLLVAAMLPNREDEDQLYLCALEQRILEEKLAEMRSDLSIHGDAVQGEAESDFKEDTGTSMQDRTHRPGKAPKKTSGAKAMASAAKSFLTPKKQVA